MAWIELHQAVWTHRKTMMLGAALGIEDIYAAAHMARLWCWALDSAQDGDLSRIPDSVIARAAEWRGDPQAFMDGAKAAGFIDADGMLHDWWEYAGRLIESRDTGHDANEQRKSDAEARVRSAIMRLQAKGDPVTLRALQSEAGCGRSTAQRVLREVQAVRSERSERSGPSGPESPVRSEPTQPNRTQPNTTEPPGTPKPPVGGVEPAADAEGVPPVDVLPETPAPAVATPQQLATAAYDLLDECGHKPSDGGWFGKAIGRIGKLRPEARVQLLGALRQATEPSEWRYTAGNISACDFGPLIDRYGGGQARASPSSASAQIDAFLAIGGGDQ